MKAQAKKIALVTQVTDLLSLANAQFLAHEGFHVAITAPIQAELSNAVEFIGHGAMGLLNGPADIGGLFSVYQKVTCYFGGRINVLLLNNVNISLQEITDFSEAYFTIQYALPYLDAEAIILLNTGLLTKERLSMATNERKSKSAFIKCQDTLTKTSLPSFLKHIQFGDVGS